MHTDISMQRARDRRSLSLAAVILSTFGVGIAYGIGYPLTALTFEAWQTPYWVTGLAGTAPAIAIIACLPFFPSVMDRLGAVTAMVLGCCVVAIGFVALWALPSVAAWIVIRFVMGAGLALPWLVGETWINTLADSRYRGRIMALYTIALFSGFAVGPFLIGLTGIEDFGIFGLGAAGVALAIVPLVLARRIAPDLHAHGGAGILSAARLAPAAIIIACLGGALELAHFSLLPNVLIALGRDEAEALRMVGLFMLGGVALQFLLGWLSDRMNRVRLAVAMMVAAAALAALMPAAAETGILKSAVVFVLGGIAIGFYTLGLTILGDRVPPGHLATANAALLMAVQAGGALGPIAAGVAMSSAGPIGFTVAVATASLATALLLTLRRW